MLNGNVCCPYYKEYTGNSLAVQWLELRAFTVGVWVQSLELRSHKPRGTTTTTNVYSWTSEPLKAYAVHEHTHTHIHAPGKSGFTSRPASLLQSSTPPFIARPTAVWGLEFSPWGAQLGFSGDSLRGHRLTPLTAPYYPSMSGN